MSNSPQLSKPAHSGGHIGIAVARPPAVFWRQKLMRLGVVHDFMMTIISMEHSLFSFGNFHLCEPISISSVSLVGAHYSTSSQKASSSAPSLPLPPPILLFPFTMLFALRFLSNGPSGSIQSLQPLLQHLGPILYTSLHLRNGERRLGRCGSRFWKGTARGRRHLAWGLQMFFLYIRLCRCCICAKCSWTSICEDSSPFFYILDILVLNILRVAFLSDSTSPLHINIIMLFSAMATWSCLLKKGKKQKWFHMIPKGPVKLLERQKMFFKKQSNNSHMFPLFVSFWWSFHHPTS